MIRNMHIELISSCNLACKMCCTHKYGDKISFEKYADVMNMLCCMNDMKKTEITNVENWWTW